MEACRAGANHAVHLYNAMPAFTHRAPGVVGAVFDNKDVMAEIICDGIHIHPSVVRATFQMMGADRMILISDSMRATGMPDGQYTLGGLDVKVVGRLATLVSDGAIAHDSKSAAFLELWNHPELDSAVVFLLNRNLGGAIITNHQIHQGSSMHSGTLEHMCVNPDGPLCYCGNHGCLETYCSANALEQSAGMPVKEFFPLLREKKSPRLAEHWEDYLNHLAFAMKNLNLIIDAPIIISGYLAPYFTEEDINYLLEHINTDAPFTLDRSQILVGTHGQYTPAIGAALYYVEKFTQSV